MGLFSRTSSRPAASPQPILDVTLDELRDLGERAFGGESPHPPGFSGLTSALDGHAIAYLQAAGFPDAGSPAARVAAGQLLDQLNDAATRAGGLAAAGALAIAWNTLAGEDRADPRFIALQDGAADALRLDGVSYTAVPPYLIDRWTAVHGYEGSAPAGWPSALADVPVPGFLGVPPVRKLSRGGSRKLAQSPTARENTIWAEAREDGTIQAVVEAPDAETGTPRRWDWEGLTAPDYEGFLRELGERLVTHSAWAHEDLEPCFPCRPLSRDQMRVAARAWSAA